MCADVGGSRRFSHLFTPARTLLRGLREQGGSDVFSWFGFERGLCGGVRHRTGVRWQPLRLERSLRYAGTVAGEAELAAARRQRRGRAAALPRVSFADAIQPARVA